MYTSDDIYKQLANNQYINIDYWPHIFGLLSRENKKGIHFFCILNCKMKLELRNWDKGACPFIPIDAVAGPLFSIFV